MLHKLNDMIQELEGQVKPEQRKPQPDVKPEDPKEQLFLILLECGTNIYFIYSVEVWSFIITEIKKKISIFLVNSLIRVGSRMKMLSVIQRSEFNMILNKLMLGLILEDFRIQLRYIYSDLWWRGYDPTILDPSRRNWILIQLLNISQSFVNLFHKKLTKFPCFFFR